jgi:beta-phosphoglucomutase
MVTIADISAEAVIFDFDGVIVDTEPLHFQAFQQVLNPRGIAFTWDEYVETYMGFDDRDAFREAYRVHSQTLADSELLQLIQLKAAAFITIIQNGITPYPGVVELIDHIKESGTPLAISSGALKSDIEPILGMLGISDCFDVIVTADDVAQSKPDPECYILARLKLQSAFGKNIPAGSVVAIEDTPAGIHAAKGAGLQVIGVTNSYPAEMLDDAHLIVSSLLQFSTDRKSTP